MRVYHFINQEHGLDDLRTRRLKIATILELNDPFELFAINHSDESVRRAFRVMKEELAQSKGLLCFSRSWRNPVQWSHYADKHRGICLGFDVPDELLGRVSYSRKRLVAETEQLVSPHQVDSETARQFLFTKYAHWRYEDEVRCFVNLEQRDPETNLYFTEFSPQLNLREVIVGACSNLTRATVNQALGDNLDQVAVFKVRLAFKTFKVVRQKNKGLWT